MSINFWALMFSAIASMVLGFVWYGQLFGDRSKLYFKLIKLF